MRRGYFGGDLPKSKMGCMGLFGIHIGIAVLTGIGLLMDSAIVWVGCGITYIIFWCMVLRNE